MCIVAVSFFQIFKIYMKTFHFLFLRKLSTWRTIEAISFILCTFVCFGISFLSNLLFRYRIRSILRTLFNFVLGFVIFFHLLIHAMDVKWIRWSEYTWSVWFLIQTNLIGGTYLAERHEHCLSLAHGPFVLPSKIHHFVSLRKHLRSKAIIIWELIWLQIYLECLVCFSIDFWYGHCLSILVE